MSVYEFTEEELSRPQLPTLEELRREPDSTADALLQRVAAAFEVSTDDICSEARSTSVVRARHAYWQELRNRGWSSTEIGNMTGHEHTAVLYAVRGDSFREQKNARRRAAYRAARASHGR